MSASSMSSVRSLTVLVADDDDDDRSLISRAWARGRNADELSFVEDGQQLFEYLNHSGQYGDAALAPRPSVILLDLNMPRKDGREVLKEIKADPDLRQIPIIILTTSQDDEDIRTCYDLGASSFITKPPSFGELVDVLQVVGKYWTEIVHLPQQIN